MDARGRGSGPSMIERERLALRSVVDVGDHGLLISIAFFIVQWDGYSDCDLSDPD